MNIIVAFAVLYCYSGLFIHFVECLIWSNPLGQFMPTLEDANEMTVKCTNCINDCNELEQYSKDCGKRLEDGNQLRINVNSAQCTSNSDYCNGVTALLHCLANPNENHDSCVNELPGNSTQVCSACHHNIGGLYSFYVLACNVEMYDDENDNVEYCKTIWKFALRDHKCVHNPSESCIDARENDLAEVCRACIASLYLLNSRNDAQSCVDESIMVVGNVQNCKKTWKDTIREKCGQYFESCVLDNINCSSCASSCSPHKSHFCAARTNCIRAYQYCSGEKHTNFTSAYCELCETNCADDDYLQYCYFYDEITTKVALGIIQKRKCDNTTHANYCRDKKNRLANRANILLKDTPRIRGHRIFADVTNN